MRKILITLVLLASAWTPNVILAAPAADCQLYCENLSGSAPLDPPTSGICVCPPLSSSTFEGIIGKIIDFIFKIAVVLGPLLIVVGGAMFVTSAGNLQKTSQAKKLMIWTAAGLLIIIMAKGLLAVVEQILGMQ
ncbi:MAG: hypothetical protein HY443_01655 [Candidatus Nealsonbacteria bacterium]|nr:hypothetical protein [Candidatus Nealsonbacteria bacterium]